MLRATWKRRYASLSPGKDETCSETDIEAALHGSFCAHHQPILGQPLLGLVRINRSRRSTLNDSSGVLRVIILICIDCLP